MTARDFESPAFANQAAERIDRAGAAPDVRRDGRAGDAEFRERTKPENETRPKHDVERVGQPQHAHGNRCITRAPKDRIDHKQHDHRSVAAKHDARKPDAMLDYGWRGAHYAQ